MQKWHSLKSMGMVSIARTKCSAALLISLILFASCGANNSNNNAPTTTAPAKPRYDVVTVEIQNMKFVPDSIVVHKGDEVVFVNRDMVNHCVTEEKSKAWTSGIIPAGQSYLLVAKENAGYYCAIHTVMKGKIVVQ